MNQCPRHACGRIVRRIMKHKKPSAARCPLRPGDPCSLCQPGADGPHNCGLVYLVMDDPELRELYAEQLKRTHNRHERNDKKP